MDYSHPKNKKCWRSMSTGMPSTCVVDCMAYEKGKCVALDGRTVIKVKDKPIPGNSNQIICPSCGRSTITKLLAGNTYKSCVCGWRE